MGLLKYGGAIALVGLLLCFPLVSFAGFKVGDEVFIGSDQVIKNNLFVAGDKIDVLGEVFGDVFAAGKQIEIAGVVHGNVFVAGQSVFLKGTVEGSVYAAGSIVHVAGSLKNNLYASGEVIDQSSESVVGWNVTTASNLLTLRGTVKGDVVSSCDACTFDGSVAGNMELVTKENGVLFLPNARVQGNVVYAAPSAFLREGNQIKGVLLHRELEQENPWVEKIFQFGFYVLSTLAMSLLIWALMRQKLRDITQVVHTKPWQMVGWGLLAMMAPPLVAVLLLFTVVGLPLATLLMLSYFSALLVVYPITSIVLGHLCIKQEKGKKMVLSLLVGALILSVLRMIPVVSGVVFFVSIVVGLGTLVLVKYHNWQLIMKKK